MILKSSFLLIFALLFTGLATENEYHGEFFPAQPIQLTAESDGPSEREVSYGYSIHIIRSFPTPGSSPTDLGWDGSALWCSDISSDKLYKIDPATGNIISTINAPGTHPTGLAWDGVCLWNADLDTDKLYKLDPMTGTILGQFDAPVDNTRGLVWIDGYVYLTDSGTDTVYRLNPATGLIDSLYLAPFYAPRGLAYDGVYLWHCDGTKEKLILTERDAGRVILTLPSPGTYPWGLAWDGTHLWNLDADEEKIYQLEFDFSMNTITYDPVSFNITFSDSVTVLSGSIDTMKTYISLPKSDARQSLLAPPLFSPQPDNYVTDQWGQEAAYFKELDVTGTKHKTMAAKVELSVLKTYLTPEKVGSLAEVPSDIKTVYTQDTENYQINDAVIVNAVQEAVGSETDLYWQVRKIHDYIIDHLTYYADGSWDPAPIVLQQGHGSCSEYTYAMIAMCRHLGIPARYTGATLLRGELPAFDGSFHRWSEVYLPPFGWVPIDVQGDDEVRPGYAAENFGLVKNGALVLLKGGGPSDYLDWYYNSYHTYRCSSGCSRDTDRSALWDEYTPNEDNLTIPLVAGWNWFSINFENDDMNPNTVLSGLAPNGAFIKNQTSFATYYGGTTGWYSSNGLDVIDPKSMYMIKMAAKDTLVFSGQPVDMAATPISLAGGWNWIGYLPQAAIAMNGALSSIAPNGSFIKNQTQFATYYGGTTGWYSSNGLDEMQPGFGYMLRMNAADELIYPTPAGALAKSTETGSKVFPADWIPEIHKYEHSMAITGVVVTDGRERKQEDLVIGAFVGDECRGVAGVAPFPLNGRYEFGLLVHGEEDEVIRFKVREKSDDFEAVNTMIFTVNGVIGDGPDPYILQIAKTVAVEIPSDYQLYRNHPNPFNPVTTIAYDLPGDSEVRLEIYDIRGQLVRTLQRGEQAAGHYDIQWDAHNEQGLPVVSGLYFVRMMSGEFRQTYKMIFAK